MKSLKEFCMKQLVFKKCVFRQELGEKWLNCSMACIPMKVSAQIESTQFWYCENWCNKFIEIDKCECEYCVLLKQLRDKTNRLYSGKFNLVFFLSNLDDFF